MNQQKPEPSRHGEDPNVLDVHSVFLTVQGEGPFTGHTAVFVRLAGCNLQCPGCDTEYTRGRRLMNIDDLVSEVGAAANPVLRYSHLVVITGGEPLRQPIGKFVRRLITTGYRVQIESNGMFAPDNYLRDALKIYSGEVLCLVVSPKTPKINLTTALAAHAFKYVLDHRSVGDNGLPRYALENEVGDGVAKPAVATSRIPIYLTPYDDPADPEAKYEANMAAVIRSCMEYGYIAGMQLHKFLNLP